MYLIISIIIMLVLIIYAVQQSATIRVQQQHIKQQKKVLRQYEINMIENEKLIATLISIKAKYSKLLSTQKRIDKAMWKH